MLAAVGCRCWYGYSGDHSSQGRSRYVALGSVIYSSASLHPVQISGLGTPQLGLSRPLPIDKYGLTERTEREEYHSVFKARYLARGYGSRAVEKSLS